MNRIIRILFIIVSITGMLLLNGVYMKIQAQAITTQPVDVDFCTGSTKDASFTVGGASILTYQWQRYVFDIVKPYWEDIRNETDSKLVIPAPTGGWSSKYEIIVRCEVTSKEYGTEYSRAASVNVYTKPSITTQPASQEVFAKSNVTFSVVVSSTLPVTYQWYFKGVAISGETGSSLKLLEVSTKDEGGYYCITINDCGSSTSNTATLNIVGITGDPESKAVCEKSTDTVKFSVSADGALAYQWQKYIIPDELKPYWADIKDATSSLLTLTTDDGWSTKDNGQFRCAVTFAPGDLISGSASLTVNTRPNISKHPASQEKYEGESVTFSVTATSTLEMSYQWQKDEEDIPGAENKSFTIPSVTSGDAGIYRCKITNSCGEKYSTGASLTVIVLAWDQGWFSQTANTFPENSKFMYDVHAINENSTWIAVTEYTDSLLFTNNGGESWDWTHTGVSGAVAWQTVFFTDADHGWVAGYGKIAYTTNGGTLWSVWDSAAMNPEINDLFMINSTTGWAAGNNGVILKTTSGGVYWKPQTSGKTADFSQVHFADELNGIVVGSSGNVIYTSDGGTTWNAPAPKPAEVDLNAVFMVNPDTAFIAGTLQSGSGYMHMKTSDGGITWGTLPGPAYDGYDIEFVNADEGWMCCTEGKIFYTNNGGLNWYEQDTETSQTLYAISMVDADNGWSVGDNGTMLRTAFGGCFLPKVSLYDDKTFCSGELYSLVADSFNNEYPVYSWNTSETTGSIEVDTTGIYKVVVANVCGDQASDSVFIQFYDLSEVDAGADVEICEGDSIQLLAVGGIAYTWSPDTLLDNAGIPNPFAKPPVGITAFTVVATDTNGCSNSSQVNVTVHPIPTATFSYPDYVCGIDDATITYTGTATAGATYTWDFNGGDSTWTGSSYLVNWDQTGSKTICLVVEENGCVSDTNKQSLNVNPIPYSDFEVQGAVCGDNTTAIAYLGIDSIDAGYAWDFDGGVIVSGEDEGPYLVNWATEGTKTISLQVTQDGCISSLTSTDIIVSYPYEGEEICLVTVDLETGKNLVVFEKTPDVGVEYYNIYRESDTAGIYTVIGTIPADSLSVFVDTGSSPEEQQHLYKISVVDTCGNESTLSPFHKTLLLQYNGSVGGVNLRWDKYEIQGVPIDFANYIIYRGTDSTKLEEVKTISGSLNSWIDTDPVALTDKYYYRIAGVKGETCDPANLLGKKAGSGPYSHSLSNIEDNRLQASGLHELSGSAFNFSVYPNPFSQSAKLTYSLNERSSVKIEVFNILGARIARIVNEIQAPGEFIYELKATDLGSAEGVFYLRITINEYHFARKMILAR